LEQDEFSKLKKNIAKTTNMMLFFCGTMRYNFGSRLDLKILLVKRALTLSVALTVLILKIQNAATIVSSQLR
jgi:hypothetical protein